MVIGKKKQKKRQEMLNKAKEDDQNKINDLSKDHNFFKCEYPRESMLLTVKDM